MAVEWGGISEADRLDLFTEWGEIATVGGSNCPGRFMDGYAETQLISGAKPVFTTTEQAAAAVGLAYQATIVIAGAGTYEVSAPARPDGAGLVTFELTKTG